MILTGRQIRECRVLAGLSQDHLTKSARVGGGLIARSEAAAGEAIARKPDLGAIQRALEAASVEFTPRDDGVEGVRLRRAEP